MRRAAIGTAAFLVSMLAPFSLSTSASASVGYHATAAVTCRPGYHRATLKKIVGERPHRHTVRYVGCVVNPVPTTTTTTTTTTTLPPSPALQVDVSRSGSGQLFTGVGFNLEVDVAEPSNASTAPPGTVTFESDGQVLSFCTDVQLQTSFLGVTDVSSGEAWSTANCGIEFSEPGTYTITAVANGTDGSSGAGTLTITVSS